MNILNIKTPCQSATANLYRLIQKDIITYKLLLFVFAITFFISSKTGFSQEISYHPNKYWTVKGEPVIKKSNVRFNYFNPQYGYPQRNLAGKSDYDEWEQWKAKNGFSYVYKLEGHAWQGIITANKEIFKQHPEYLAEIKGKRVGYGKTWKLCISNKNAQEVFIQDRLTAFSKLNNPEGSVSVEPSDGAGFCECTNCKKMGSTSNQVFYLANLTAKRIKAKFPGGKVNLYAYYRHAELPDFDIEPNVHVTVVPAGFQSIYDGNVMLGLWAKKVKLKTYYEYFTIPQQKGEQPRLYIQDFLERMNIAKKLGYQGYWFETGVNINSAIALVIFNQLWMDTTLTWEIATEKFLRNSFPGSYTPMKRLFERWWHTWLEDDEIAAALYDLDEADELIATSDEKERIADLKAYAHYLVLYSEWSKDKQNISATQNLFGYLYQSSYRAVVNGPALYEIFRTSLNKTQKDDLNWRKPESKKLAGRLTEQAIERNFDADKRKYGSQKTNFAFVTRKDGIQTVLKRADPLKKFRLTCKKMADKIYLYSEDDIEIKLIKPVDHNNNKDGKLLLSLVDAEGTIYFNDFVHYSNPVVKIKLPSKKIYTLSLLQYFSTEIEISGKIIPIADKSQIEQVKSKKAGIARKKRGVDNKPVNYYFITEEK